MYTLLLNSWMAPDRIVDWQRAVVLVVLGKVDVLEVYDEEIRARTFALRAPAVVRLKKAVARRKVPVRFNRAAVFARDELRCQYCGALGSPRDLNFDHVVPRSRGGRTSWENIVTSCYACNQRKRNRTPDEAGMMLRKKPVKPRAASAIPFAHLSASEVPEAWRPWLVPRSA